MFVRSKDHVPKRVKGGLCSHILIEKGDEASSKLAITWVDIDPGAAQTPHRHAPEQVYVIVSGVGRMQVGEEFREVRAGDVVFVPSDVMHGITNSAESTLSYVSASTPSFSLSELYDTGMLSNR